MSRVLYAGSFDPITKGHMNIIKEASDIFDEIVVAVLQNPLKNTEFFNVEERLNVVKDLYKDDKNIVVVTSDKAAVDIALEYNCKAMIRGLRSLTDYDYEVGLNEINKDISGGKVNTICLFADSKYQFISSSMVREMFRLNKDISRYVEPLVEKEMIKKRVLR